jgi:putative Ca2+/H+ antiporter (TMEM165/GDT1 family)
MGDFLTAALTAFGIVLIVELPDKTLVASLVLSTRYRPRPVLVGVAAAFAVQCVIAVTAGGLLHLLPHRVVAGIVAVLFAFGAWVLYRESRADPEELDIDEHAIRQALPFGRIALISFGVLFAAEWGDASQLATAALAAKLGNPVAVGLGSWVALVLVAAIAVVAGRFVVRRVPVRVIHRVAAVVFLVFSVLAAYSAFR